MIDWLLEKWSDAEYEALQEELRRLEAAHGMTRARRRELRDQVVVLTRRVDRLRVVAMALYELLEAHGPLDHEALVRKIEEVDLRDGRQDDRLAEPGETARCVHCHRVLSQTFGRCLYCASWA